MIGYEEKSQTVLCLVCHKQTSDANKRTTIIVSLLELRNLKLEAMKDHESSKGHIHDIKLGLRIEGGMFDLPNSTNV